jgi:APA family basic amino acid/polyamine antiporter
VAFISGWVIVFSGVVAASTVAVGFAGYFRSFLQAPASLIAIMLIGLLSLLNFIGIEESSRVNIMFTGIEISGLFLIVLLGVGRSPNVNYFEAPFGFTGIIAAAALVFFAYIGFEDIANMAEETENPRKTIPRALIISVMITTGIYVLVAISTVNLADWTELGDSEAPLAYAASLVLGNNAFLILSAIALFATANTVLILLIVGSRMVYGMAKEGSLPKVFSIVHRERSTPWPAIFAVMLPSMLFATMGDLEVLASVTNFAAFTTFALVNSSLIVLRFKKPDIDRPFRVPLNIGKFPVISFLGLVSCAILASHLLTGGAAYYLLKKSKSV